VPVRARRGIAAQVLASSGGPHDTLLWTADGSPTLWSARYGETYRSRRGAHTEARHVFLEGTGVAGRLTRGASTAVLEVGLGAATNLVWTAAAALASAAPLRYQAWEPQPLPAAQLADLRLETVAPADFVAGLLAARDAWGALPSGARRTWTHRSVRLELVVAPISEMAATPTEGAVRNAFDAVYLDPFSPAVNPEAWTPAVLTALARALRPGGILASYCVAGTVRRALAAAGLEVAKVAGPPGGKREVLRARRPVGAGP